MKKDSYGLKHARRAWYKRIGKELRGLRTKPATTDSCVCLKHDTAQLMIIVDDILVMS